MLEERGGTVMEEMRELGSFSTIYNQDIHEIPDSRYQNNESDTEYIQNSLSLTHPRPSLGVFPHRPVQPFVVQHQPHVLRVQAQAAVEHVGSGEIVDGEGVHGPRVGLHVDAAAPGVGFEVGRQTAHAHVAGWGEVGLGGCGDLTWGVDGVDVSKVR